MADSDKRSLNQITGNAFGNYDEPASRGGNDSQAPKKKQSGGLMDALRRKASSFELGAADMAAARDRDKSGR